VATPAVATTGAETTSAADGWDHAHGRLGDEAAAARTRALFHDYGRVVTVLCRALLRDRAEAEDAAQQTFLSAHRALLAGTVPREPAAWIAAIARNECRARVRTRMREPLPAEEIEAVSRVGDPVAEALRRSDLAALWAAVQALPRQQREALVLRELGGLSYDELAEALAVSGAAVESLLFRARRRLRKTLRAAAASLSGLPWLETLVGGSAPVAAKVAVLGVGAAALTGGIVGPVALDDRHPPHAPAHVRAHEARLTRDASQRAVRPAATAPAAEIASVVLRRHTVAGAPRHEMQHDGRHDTTRTAGSGNEAPGSTHDGSATVVRSSRSGSSDGAEGGSRRDGSEGDAAPVTVAPVTAARVTATPVMDAPVTSGSSGDGEHGSSGGSGDGGSNDGISSGDGSGGGGEGPG
jgi:RNA polymerase sigma factor (sigma-70 family)